MASAFSAAMDQNYEISCGWCLENIGYLENIGEIPCGDIYCGDCYKNHYENRKEIECRVCRRTVCNKFTLLELPDGKGRPKTKALQCVGCGDKEINKEPSIYCTKCDTLLCNEHSQAHDEILKDHAGAKVKVEDYKSNPNRYQMKICQNEDHKDAKIPVNMACKICYKLFCNRCNDKTRCVPVNNSGIKAIAKIRSTLKLGSHQHSLVSITKLATELKAEHTAMSKTLADRMTLASKLEKAAGVRISDNEDKLVELEKKIDETVEDQIKQIQASAEEEKQVLRNAGSQNNQVIAGYFTGLRERREELTRVRFQTTEHLSNCHDVDIISEFAQRKADIEQQAAEKIDENCPVLSSCYLVTNDPSRKCEWTAKVSTNPIALSLKARTDDRVKCPSLCWSQKSDELVVGVDKPALTDDLSSVESLAEALSEADSDQVSTHNGHAESLPSQADSLSSNKLSERRQERILDDYLRKIHHTSSTVNNACSMVEFKGKVIALVNDKNGSIIEEYARDDEGKPASVFPKRVKTAYQHVDFTITHLTTWTNKKLLMTKDKKLVTNEETDVFNTVFGKEVLEDIEAIGGMLGTDGGDLYVTNSKPDGSLHKYELHGDQLVDTWRCDGLVDPTTIQTDSHGNILVASASAKLIYCISPSGEKQIEISTSCYSDANIADIAVHTNKVAVALYGSGVQVFKIKYQDMDHELKSVTPTGVVRRITRKLSNLTRKHAVGRERRLSSSSLGQF